MRHCLWWATLGMMMPILSSSGPQLVTVLLLALWLRKGDWGERERISPHITVYKLLPQRGDWIVAKQFVQNLQPSEWCSSEGIKLFCSLFIILRCDKLSDQGRYWELSMNSESLLISVFRILTASSVTSIFWHNIILVTRPIVPHWPWLEAGAASKNINSKLACLRSFQLNVAETGIQT